ncbi:MAG: DDE-type integrase/transposase/recombinase [Rhodospirillales bacterium]
MRNPFRYFNSSPAIIRLTVMMYIRYPLSLRQVENLLFECGIDICHETIRFWWNRFGPMFAAEIRKRRAMKRYGRPKVIVTDRLRSNRTALNVIGNAAKQECGRWLNNRAENSHQPFRRRKGAMSKFRDVKTLQNFASAHASIHNHFKHDRHLNSRNTFKQNRSTALDEWRQLAA